MSGEIGRKGGGDADDEIWSYAAEVRILDKKGMGGGRGIVEYPGVPLPDEDLAELGVAPGDRLGLSRETEEYPGVEIHSIVYALDGSGEKTRQIRGGSASKPTWLISLPYEWVEPVEYPIDSDEEPSFLPLEDGEHVVLELDRSEELLRLYRNEDYMYRLGGLAADEAFEGPGEMDAASAPMIRPFFTPGMQPEDLDELLDSIDFEAERAEFVEKTGKLALVLSDFRDELEIEWDELIIDE